MLLLHGWCEFPKKGGLDSTDFSSCWSNKTIPGCLLDPRSCSSGANAAEGWAGIPGKVLPAQQQIPHSLHLQEFLTASHNAFTTA